MKVQSKDGIYTITKIKKCACGNEIKVTATRIDHKETSFKFEGVLNADFFNRVLCVCYETHPFARTINAMHKKLKLVEVAQ